MADNAHFNYDTTGLPDDTDFRVAAEICHQWLLKNMSVFGPERIASFMHNQPVAAAKLLTESAHNASRESVIVALLGPAKFELISTDGSNHDATKETASRRQFGDRVVNLVRYMGGMDVGKEGPDNDLFRDAHRMFLVEGLSTMNDQLIGRKRIDPHHKVRWQILLDLEKGFGVIKGENPAIDDVFEKALKESRAALETLDREARLKAAQTPHKPT